MPEPLDHERHARIVGHLRATGSVSHCLPYEDMMEVTPEFDQFARQHASAIDGISWHDLCPAYALALMTHHTYELPEDDEALEVLWEELAPSDLDWHQAKSVVADTWRWLDAPRRLS